MSSVFIVVADGEGSVIEVGLDQMDVGVWLLQLNSLVNEILKPDIIEKYSSRLIHVPEYIMDVRVERLGIYSR